jgi:hypothetical protein
MTSKIAILLVELPAQLEVASIQTRTIKVNELIEEAKSRK